MRHQLIVIFLICHTAVFSQSNTYVKAWNALNSNKRAEAEKLIQQSMSDPATAQDAFITNLYLKSYNGKEKDVTDFASFVYQKATDPYPYIYALWFNKAVLGEYGKKNMPHQLSLMDKLIGDEKTPGTLVAAANYQKELHYLFSGNFDKLPAYSQSIGNIRNWQFAGPFENLSESGFYKNYGPLEHPEPTAVFKSLSNAEVKWFTPAHEVNDGWISASFPFNKTTAVIYAQNFVSSSTDQTVYCNIGFNGAVKVWINDVLVISEARELVTEMDNSTVKYDLKKGVNRVLLQLSYTNTSYPCFSLRFTNDKYRVISNIVGSPVYAAYPKNSGADAKYTVMPHFAEAYFLYRLEKEPANFVNYLLLADVYIRSNKLSDARSVISRAIDKAPGNSLLRMKLINILTKENNRTLLLEEIEKLKQSDPESLIVFDLNIKEFYNNEKFEDCEKELAKRIELHGEDETTMAYQILLLGQDKKIDELVKLVENMYVKYPGNAYLASTMYNVKKEIYKDKKAGLKIYDDFMKDYYNYDVYIKYADILIEQGETEKGLAVKEKIIQTFKYDPNGPFKLANYYFDAKQYDKAEEYLGKSMSISPYNEKYWELSGDIKSEKNDVAGALDAYNESLKFDPNQYNLISKIRKRNNKPEISKLFGEVNIPDIIKNDHLADAKNADYGYYYILDQKDVVIYPDGAHEEYVTAILRITNDKGVERYKESSIGYDNSQTLLIEKAEIIKKNNAKIEGERNQNEIVFTNLEVGDIIVFKYRLQSYIYGRFAKDFWDKYHFTGQIYSGVVKYNLIMPATRKIDYVFTNSNLKPAITNVENFKKYSWILEKAEPLKDEPFMPQMVDVGNVLHVSTVSSWKEIADWYSDAVNNKSEEDYEIKNLYQKLFPSESKSVSQFEKAKKIYEYIETNIRYSSVSFRQSALIPQRASATVTSRLGDCKDLSNLFVTLAHMAGINAQMVLVDTRDNGQDDMVLPSVEFNHCIAKAMLDGKSYFIELTDNYLPFASLPNNLNGALALEIPSKTLNEKAGLIKINSETRTKDVIKRVIDIRPVDDDLNVSVKTVKYGAFTSDVRTDFRSLSNEKQLQQMEESIAGAYKNNVRVEKVNFTNVDKLNDSVAYFYNYKVKNEIAEMGSMRTFKVIYPDLIATLDNFSADKRDFPIEYWRYENADAYETTVNIAVPAGKKIIELPESESISFQNMKYSIRYTLKTADKLTIIRKFFNDRNQQISPKEYPEFKTFFEKIVKAEQKFIVYK